MCHSVCIYMFVILSNAINMQVRIHLLILRPHTQSYICIKYGYMYMYLYLPFVVSSEKCMKPSLPNVCYGVLHVHTSLLVHGYK